MDVVIDMVYVAKLCEAGKVVPVIDRRYPLIEIVEAPRYLGEGRVKERVMIIVQT